MEPSIPKFLKKRRSDLDALRALAILIVFGYHLNIPFLKNGFIGVDIFFVLSGYLTTAVCLENPKNLRKELISFYKRRANRLIPALFFMLLFCGLLIWILVPLKTIDFAQNALLSLSFTSNIYYYLTSGYFATSSQLNFLLHSWSLSLEFQFYLCYPLLIFVFQIKGRQSRQQLENRFLLLLLISFICMLILSVQDERAAFYLLPSRLWEFISGALAFLSYKRVVNGLSSRLRQVGAFVCWLILLANTLLGGHVIGMEGWPWIVALTVLSVVGIILFDVQVFESNIITWLAKNSYGIYLWHWPLIVLCTYLGVSLSFTVSAVLIVLTILFANVSYQFIESKNLFTNTKLQILGLVTLSLSAILVHPKAKDVIMNSQQLRDFQLLHQYKTEKTPLQYGFLTTHLQHHEPFNLLNITSRLKLSDSGGNYLLLGDCHAGMFSYTLKRIAQQKGINLIVFSMDETFPASNALGKFVGPQDQMNYIFNQLIPSHYQKLDKVILMADYSNYSANELKAFFTHNRSYFSQFKLPIVYIGQTKKYRIEFPVASSQHERWKIPLAQYELSAPYRVNRFIKTLPEIHYVDLLSSQSSNAGKDGQLFMYDTNHYTIGGTERLSKLLETSIFK
ncbi:acyltransferase family protein [Sphingobacterium sp. DK4209]|uniref:Acyltransferase family protein n=1 Tax=Sphingobacterium zhuxiongii TaxID=2662364 RepID=A0A5Q0QIB4_9SPHI|nr:MULTISPECIES: acyltransferase family protein [unclassified Sphingobacterium]MVZ65750.1 acyltransferase family protein [Sphingobacterium sp. DK4209]QGA27948.1 acyltransferase family protein [Sphingobacterium sp. dk4302]